MRPSDYWEPANDNKPAPVDIIGPYMLFFVLGGLSTLVAILYIAGTGK